MGAKKERNLHSQKGSGLEVVELWQWEVSRVVKWDRL